MVRWWWGLCSTYELFFFVSQFAGLSDFFPLILAHSTLSFHSLPSPPTIERGDCATRKKIFRKFLNVLFFISPSQLSRLPFFFCSEYFCDVLFFR